MKKSIAAIVSVGLTLGVGLGVAVAGPPVEPGEEHVTPRGPIPAIADPGRQFPASCDVILWETYDNTHGPNFGRAWIIQNFSPVWAQAFQFTAEETALLCEIRMYAAWQSGENLARLTVYRDRNDLPGDPLASWDLNSVLPFGRTGTPVPETIVDAAGANLVLEEGLVYWIGFEATSRSNSEFRLFQGTIPGLWVNRANLRDNVWTSFGANERPAAYRLFGAPEGLRISVSGSCPGSVTVQWSGATPNSNAGLVFARNQGNVAIPSGPCQGTQLGLGSNQIQLVRTFSTGANGSGQMSGNAGVGACGGFLQVVVADGSPCDTSNVGQIP